MKKVIEMIREMKIKLDELERSIKNEHGVQQQLPLCYPNIEIGYVSLCNSSNKEKMERIIEQLREYNINMLTTANDSNIVRSAIVAEFGEEGLDYWLSIRKQRENFNEENQTEKYNYLVTKRSKNTMTFGAVINRYKQSIDLFNVNSNTKMQ